MSDFEVTASCLEIALDAELDELSITFPGGFVLQLNAPPGIDVMFALDVAKQILAAVNAALMPLQPIFNIIDALLVVLEFAKAVPDAITSLDPGKIFDVLPKLSAKIDKLIAIIPPLSIPVLIKAILRVVILYLTGMKAALRTIATAQLEVGAARARATIVASFSLEASLALGAAADCAAASAAISLSALGQGATPLNSLLGIIRGFVELVGLPVKIPTFVSLGGDATVAGNALDALIVVLTDVRQAIVV